MQVPEAPLPDNTQFASKVPVLLVVNGKFPVGVIVVPTEEVSVTVTVHVEAEPVLTCDGMHVMLVVVARTVAVKVVEPLLLAWVVSPG